MSEFPDSPRLLLVLPGKLLVELRQTLIFVDDLIKLLAKGDTPFSFGSFRLTMFRPVRRFGHLRLSSQGCIVHATRRCVMPVESSVNTSAGSFKKSHHVRLHIMVFESFLYGWEHAEKFSDRYAFCRYDSTDLCICREDNRGIGGLQVLIRRSRD